jgi:hypothetical protein
MKEDMGTYRLAAEAAHVLNVPDLHQVLHDVGVVHGSVCKTKQTRRQRG